MYINMYTNTHTHIYLKQVSWNYTYLYYVCIFWFILFLKKTPLAVLTHKIDFMIHYFVVIHNKTLDF